ncbi:hypothetical protein LY78DRAFT_739589 [Colletotrichum sublineola]|uniref:Restriction of telomere capping protein 4 n=1 Tax=Colletotrichum sublineola TaxID=1173701 RepID=A0A066XJF1_COLSU|nr:hypothetical protein LY78DRAFT_739589 [Colletotrichum sublineola]KDN65876.1 hypothetical protein CSUB01_01890 [Colletotrichum sublineola]
MPSGNNYQKGRRAGLSRNARPPALLKTLNGKSRFEPKIDDPPMDDTESELSEPELPTTSHTMISKKFPSEKVGSKLTKPSPSPQPKDNRFQSKSKPTADFSDSDEDIRSSRADIQRTPYHGTSRMGKEQAKEYNASQERKLGLGRGASSQGSNTTARVNKRELSDESLPNLASNKKRSLTNQFDDEREARKLRGERKSYSQRGKKDIERSRKLPERPMMKSSQEKPATKRKKEGRSASPKRPQPSFKAYDDDPFDQFSGKAPQKDLINFPSLPSSPPGSPPRSKFLKHSSLSPGASPRRIIKAEFKNPTGSLPEPLQSPKRELIGLSDPGSSPKILYKKHKREKDSFLDISDHSVSDIDTETRCPMCSEIVDKALLEGFSGGARLHIRRQIQFCRLHKKKSAENAWDARGYPKIDWGILGSRLAAHHDFVLDIINGGSSHYASLLVDKVKEGKDRTLLKAEDSLTPGYYGPRGLHALSESIVGTFSSILRERAVEDRIISSRGYSSYVEAVLVPELAVQLICEDMKVKADEARTILEDSKWIGDLLHEDVGDTVDEPSDDEQARGH